MGGHDTQIRDLGWESKPGPLQRGQSFCTWEARSTHIAIRRPMVSKLKIDLIAAIFSPKVLWTLLHL